MFRWIRRLEHQPRDFFVAASVFMVFTVGFVDYATTPEISFSVFYLLALGLAAWYAGQGLRLFHCRLQRGHLAGGGHRRGFPLLQPAHPLLERLHRPGLLSHRRLAAHPLAQPPTTNSKARVRQRTPRPH